MIIHLDATAGQSVEEFATELCWIANRLEAVINGRFNGIDVCAHPHCVPSELVRQYNAKRPSPYDGVIGVPGAKLEGGFR